MSKRNKIIYWVATIWLSLGMLSSGIVQLSNMQEEVDNITRLGYPVYFLTIIGVWKILGVIAILVPRFPLVKEWAYAGFFFTASGAAISHVASGDPATELLPAFLMITLIVVSWYFRPADRNMVPAA